MLLQREPPQEALPLEVRLPAVVRVRVLQALRPHLQALVVPAPAVVVPAVVLRLLQVVLQMEILETPSQPTIQILRPIMMTLSLRTLVLSTD